MRVRSYLRTLGCVAILAVAVPTAASAAPEPQWPMPLVRSESSNAVLSSALQAAFLEGVERVFPADVIAQTPARFVPLQGNTYLVSHPALYWRVQDAPAAEALAEELAGITPGWSTRLLNGPQGRGVYLTYERS
jgi:hypothetical protein